MAKHPGHEQAGVVLVEQLGQRLRVPTQVLQLAKLVCRWHGDIHKSRELAPEQRLQLMDACDVWRKPEQFHALLAVSEADSRGRTGFEDADYPQTEHWQSWLQEVMAVTAQSFVAQGITGREIKQAMHDERLKRLQQRDAQVNLS